MVKKAAIYARVSREEQAQNYSLPTQLQSCRDYAAEHGYEVVAEFMDTYTGTEFDRPQFNELKKLAGIVDAVIIHDTDRLSRDAVDMANFNRDFLAKNTLVKFVNFSIDTSTTMGQAFLFLQGIYAQEENAKRVERTVRAKKARAASGKVMMCTVAPYGYDYDPETCQLVINAEEAQIVRQIFQWYVYGDENSKRLGIDGIASRLSDMRVPTKHDKTGFKKSKKLYGVWGYSSVNKIIHGEHYAGTWYAGKEKRRKAKNGLQKTKSVMNDRSEWIGVSVPAIVPRELWEAAQEKALQNATYSKRNTKRPYLFAGRLTCAVCGSTFRCRSDYRRHENGVGYYSCTGQERSHSADKRTVTCHRSLKQDKAEAMAWNAIIKMLLNPDAILEVIKQRRAEIEDEGVAIKEYLHGCETRLMNLGNQQKRLLDLYLDEKLSRDMLDERLAHITKEQELYHKKKADLEQRLTIMDLTTDQEEQVKLFCDQATVGIDHFTFEDKQMVIEMLNIKGIVYRGETEAEDVIVLTGFIPTTELRFGEFDTMLRSLYGSNSTSVPIAPTQSKSYGGERETVSIESRGGHRGANRQQNRCG